MTIIATGLPVANCLEAAEKLAADGIDAKVINIHTIKPLDEELVVAAAKETGKVVTVEEHSVIGGLGSAVCDVLAEKAPTKVLKIGINDTLWRVRTGSRTGKEIRTGCRQHLRKGKRILQIRFKRVYPEKYEIIDLPGCDKLPEVAWNCRFRENSCSKILYQKRYIPRKSLQREPLALAFPSERDNFRPGSDACSQKVPGLWMFPYTKIFRGLKVDLPI